MVAQAMTVPDDPWWREFIAAAPARTAKLGVVRRDGSPFVAPVWVALDGDRIVFNTGAATLKGRALRRDQRACLTFDDDRPPFSFVIVEGRVELVDDLAEVRRWAAIIAGRYMGDDQADAYGERNGVPGELLVRFTPERVHAGRDIAD
ncbi:MAG: putative F420-dependent enzyme [Acidimicrobiales bacterium]|nr:putative F420-dependent enzyme [Acidimicrobiales bacterium]